MEQPEERRVAVVIEDDADVRHLLETVLTQSGFETIVAANGPDGIHAVQTYHPIITTLDVSMPGMDGFAVAKRIRTFSNTYLVMLTALSDEIDIIQGLDSGADDYLLKPFRPRELRARIETMLRRPRSRVLDNHAEPVATISPRPTVTAIHAPPTIARAAGGAAAAATPMVRERVLVPHPAPEPAPQRPVVAQAPQPQYVEEQAVPEVEEPAAAVHALPDGSPEAWLHHRTLSLNVDTHTVVVDGAGVDLTRSEFDLLATLLTSGRRVRSKADLVLTLRGESYVTTYFVNDADKRAVEVHMANLRRKIGDSSTTPRWIETVRGVGYRMTNDD